jgi:K+-sensing histidine kinase KdpD
MMAMTLSKMQKKLYPTIRLVYGVSVAGISALLLARMFIGHPTGIFLPLWFVAVLVGLGLRYGIGVAVAGSFIAAMIFAHVLFDPKGSWHVTDAVARRNLAWMVLGSVALSYLFVRPGSTHNDRGSHS